MAEPANSARTPGPLEDEFEKVALNVAGSSWRAAWRRLGFDGHGGSTLKEAGRDLELTRERVRQIERRTLRRLRERAPPTLRFAIQGAIHVLTRCAATIHPNAAKALAESGRTRRAFLPKGILVAADALGIPHRLVIGSTPRAVRLKEDNREKDTEEILKSLSDLNHTASVDQVARRLRKPSGDVAMAFDATFLRRFLEAQEGVVWLDADKTWFWIKQMPGRNRLENRLRKALSVSRPLTVTEAHQAVFRGPRAGSNPLPHAIFASFAARAGFTVQEGQINAPHGLDPEEELSGSELHLFAAFSALGGVGRLDELRELCSQQGMNLNTFSGFMSWSPIVKRVAPNAWALVGTKAEQPAASRRKTGRSAGSSSRHSDVQRSASPSRGRKNSGSPALPGRSSGPEQHPVSAPRPDLGRSKTRLSSDRRSSHGRAIHSFGKTPDGSVWIAYSASGGIRRTGLFALPKAVREQLDEEAYTVLDTDGNEIGELENRQSTPSFAVAKYLRDRRLAPSALVLIVFDLLSAEAVLSITDQHELKGHLSRLPRPQTVKP